MANPSRFTTPQIAVQHHGRCLGLIGGLAVGATVYYYRELAKAFEAQRAVLQLLIIHADMPRVLKHVQAGEIDQLAEYLSELIRHLQAGGADFAAISSVTPHIGIRELLTISPLPLVNILDCVNDEIRARGIHRVALFGTRFTIERGLFGQLKEVELVTPRPEEIDYIHETYLQLASTGKATEEQHTGLTCLAHTLQKRDGAEAIILAGTDLNLLFHEANTDFPHIDCCRIHIQAITRAMLGTM